jgi:uncharacterized phiE125 gp8 family phage protein
MLIVPPIVEPISLQQAKDHLRETVSSQDSIISGYITAARIAAEDFMRRALVKQTHQLKLDAFRWTLELPVSPLRSVSSIQYVDWQGATQIVPAADYRVDAYSEPPRITPIFGGIWPVTQAVINAVTVNHVAGHALPFTANAGTDALTCAGHGYANGDAVPVWTTSGILPAGLAALTSYYVVNKTDDTLQLSLSAGGAVVDITSAGTPPFFLGYVPQPILQALLLIIGNLYENRQTVVVQERGVAIELPQSAMWLLRPYRVLRFNA